MKKAASMEKVYDELEQLREKARGTEALARETEKLKTRLAESEARFRTLRDTLPVGLFIIDPRTHVIVDCNDEMARVFECDKSNIIGRMCFQFVCSSQQGKCPITDLHQEIDSAEREMVTPKGKSLSVVKTVRSINVSGRDYILETFTDITEKKDNEEKAREAERALRDSERKRRLHLEQTMVGVIEWDSAFKVREWNSGAEAIFGYTREEALGRNGNELLVPEEDRPDIDELFDHLRRNDGGTRNTNDNIRKDGHRITCEWYNTPLADENGEIIGIASLILDVTARVKAEEAFRQSESFLSSVVEQSPVPTLICDDKGFLVRLNPASRSLMKVRDEEVIGKYNLLHDNLAREQGFGQLVESVYAEGRTVSFTIEYDTSRMEGVEPSETVCRVLDVTVFPVKDEAGRMTHAVVNHIDITEQRKAERALLESETKFRALFEGAAEGILVADAETRELTYANPGICELLGYSEDEFTHLTVADIHPPESWKEVSEKFEAQAKGLLHLAPETPCLTKDGRIVYCDINTSGVTIDDRDCLVGFFSDVTERRAARQSTERTNSRLKDLERIINTSPAVAFLWKNEESWPVEFVSDNIRQFGYEPQDLKDGRILFASIIHPDDLDRVSREVIGHGNDGSSEFAQEYRIHTSSGEVKWVDDHTWIRRNENGEVTHYQGILLDITDRKEAEFRLREHRDFLETLLETIPNPVFYKDENLKYTGCNRAFEQFTSKSRDQIVGKDVYETAPREIAEKYDQKDRELMKYGGTQQYEWKVQSAEGGPRNVIFDKAALVDDNGTPRALVGVITDITDRKRAEKALEKSTELLNETGHMAKIGGWEHNFETGEAIWTDALYDIFEIGLDETPPGIDSHFDYYPPKHREILEKAYRKAVDEGERFDLELQVHTLKGDLVWGRVSGEPILRDGKCVKLKGTFQDITVRKEAELETQQLARFPEENPNPVIRATTDGVITYANDASRLLMEHWNCDIGDTLPEAWRVLVQRTYQENTRTTTEIEYGGRTATFVLAPMHEEGYVNMYGMDVTEQRAAEVALRQAQKMEAIGRLASGVAHDFNNILQVIFGYSSVASHTTSPDSETAEAVAQIRNACERAVQLVRQLLIFSRREKTRKQIVDIRKQVSNLEKMLPRLLREDIDLRFVYDKDTGLIEADPGHIDQVMFNLVVNARDAMPDGGEIVVSTRNVTIPGEENLRIPDAKPGEYVELSVRDTGTGIPAEVVDKIFEPFFTTKPVGEGTGLGLATISAIVRDHGGHIKVNSRIGKGTEFRLLFPLTEDSASETKTRAIPAPDGRGELILIAEDDDILRKATENLLRRAGYNVILAADGQEAVEIIEDIGDRIDLVLLDAIMPRLNGREVYAHLHRLAPLAKVIFISGYSTGVLDQELMQREEIPLIDKPYEPEYLLKSIRELLDGASE